MKSKEATFPVLQLFMSIFNLKAMYENKIKPKYTQLKLDTKELVISSVMLISIITSNIILFSAFLFLSLIKVQIGLISAALTVMTLNLSFLLGAAYYIKNKLKHFI